ncbi:hypothetical protein ABXN37_19740 [Piscinibacter sakaiensis]|uniref:Uncharacterized protein n=1 Tax=Piscinibacter sakaiensis TaxID=1547922 RepID=A0A0K8P477_PISS1|nr:hypothetical protein [Piscinibacter sakaiensis]GAP37359.1 hypothetical protein ISF6_3214 [Piscinibacter sakaiensis]
MSGLNCRPGQRAMIVRGCQFHRCVAQRIGCPVTVSRIVTPASLLGHVMEAVDGPTWELAEAVSCPSGECRGLFLVPDRCLRPFDPDSEPGDAETTELRVEAVGEGA